MHLTQKKKKEKLLFYSNENTSLRSNEDDGGDSLVNVELPLLADEQAWKCNYDQQANDISSTPEKIDGI